MLSTAFCVALLAATAVAFALTEGAKTELSPVYRLAIAGQDAAGNRSTPVPVASVKIRYLRLGRRVVDVVPRERLALFVLTDARTVDWLLDGRRGVSRSHTLQIRAPRRPGAYTLYVTAAGHTAAASVVVGR